MFLAWSQLWMKYSVWRKTKHADEMNFIYAQVKRDKNGLWIDTLQHCILCVGPSWTGLNTMTATYGSTDHRGQRTGGLIPAERLILSEGKLRVVFNDRLSLHKSGPLKKKRRKSCILRSGSIVCNPEGLLILQKNKKKTKTVTDNVPYGCCLANVLVTVKMKWMKTLAFNLL